MDGPAGKVNGASPPLNAPDAARQAVRRSAALHARANPR